MLTIDIIVCAIAISLAVSSIDGIFDPVILQSWLQKFMISITWIVMVLTVISTWRVEKPTINGTVRPSQDLITLKDAWGIVT